MDIQAKNYCKTCPLNIPGKKVVDSSGDFNTAKVVFVGEAPGREEEVQEIPFVGKAGQLLRGHITAQGIRKFEPAFANICRCRPPENRTPTEKEIQCCVKYLRQELHEFKGLIVLLGATPLKALLSRSGLLNNQGYGFFKDGQNFFVTYHPAYVLRTPNIEEKFKNDLKKVRDFLDETSKIIYNKVTKITDLNILLNQFNYNSMVAVDIETTTISPFASNAKMLSIAFSFGEGKDNTWFVPLEHPQSPFLGKSKEIMENLRQIFDNSEAKIIGHGFKFDAKWLKALYGIEVKNFWYDTEFAHFLMVGKGVIHKLKSLAWKYTNYGGYNVDITKLEDLPLEELAEYNATDAFVTRELASIFRNELSDSQFELLSEIVSPAMMAVAEIENDGFKIDVEVLEKFTEKYTTRILEIEERLHEYPEVQEIEKEKGKIINFKSSQQLGTLFQKLNILPKKRTQKTGAASTDEEALKEVKGRHPVFADILAYREQDKILGTYLRPYKEQSDENLIIRGDYGFTRTVSGRLACSKPNFQNIPYEVRPVFTTKRDWLVEVDYSQLELRVLAMYSKDKELIKCFVEGEDIHEQTRQNIEYLIKDKSPKRQRVIAKEVNFGTVYQISSKGLATSLGISEKKAQQMINNFYERFPDVKVWIDRVKEFVLEYGYINTYFGRKRRLAFSSIQTTAQREKQFRFAVNHPIQSTASDLVFTGTGRMWKAMRKENMKGRMVIHVHDAVGFDVWDSELDSLVEMLPPIMENLKFDFINVPLKVDISVGKHWGELEEL